MKVSLAFSTCKRYSNCPRRNTGVSKVSNCYSVPKRLCITSLNLMFIHKLPPHKRFLISGAMFCRSLKDADVYTYFEPEANSSSSVVFTPLPTPTAYTMTPLFFIPLEASESLVYACVVVCLPSVITKAN